MKSLKTKSHNGKIFILLLLVIPLSFTSVVSAQSLGYKMAVIEKNGYVAEDDMLVKRFNSLLKQLENQYIDTKQEISDKTVTASQILVENGIDVNMVKMMEGMNKINDLNNSYRKYNEYLTCYLIFRVNGYNHDKSLSLLQESIDAYGIKATLKKLGIK